MGSGSDLEHFDSVASTSDYQTKNQVLFVNLNVQATDALNLYFDGSYTWSKAAFAPFNQPVPEEAPAIWDNDFSQIQDYSDLEYNQAESTLGLNYAFNPATSIYGYVTVADVTDNQEYVYGDLSGTLVLYSAGLKLDF